MDERVRQRVYVTRFFCSVFEGSVRGGVTWMCSYDSVGLIGR